MKKLVIAVVFVFGSILSYGAKPIETSNVESTFTRDLRIKVLDQKSGEALTGVAVELDGEKAYTDFDGELVLKNVTLGSHQLKTSMVSYKESSLNFVFENDTANEIALELKPIDSE